MPTCMESWISRMHSVLCNLYFFVSSFLPAPLSLCDKTPRNLKASVRFKQRDRRSVRHPEPPPHTPFQHWMWRGYVWDLWSSAGPSPKNKVYIEQLKLLMKIKHTNIRVKCRILCQRFTLQYVVCRVLKLSKLRWHKIRDLRQHPLFGCAQCLLCLILKFNVFEMSYSVYFSSISFKCWWWYYID